MPYFRKALLVYWFLIFVFSSFFWLRHAVRHRLRSMDSWAWPLELEGRANNNQPWNWLRLLWSCWLLGEMLITYIVVVVICYEVLNDSFKTFQLHFYYSTQHPLLHTSLSCNFINLHFFWDEFFFCFTARHTSQSRFPQWYRPCAFSLWVLSFIKLQPGQNSWASSLFLLVGNIRRGRAFWVDIVDVELDESLTVG